MANKSLFSSRALTHPAANAHNMAGAPAYSLTPKHALAQLAATGTFQGTFYADATLQLDLLRTLADMVDDNVFLAKLAVYSREQAAMKDMPAALLVILAKRSPELMQQVFDRVVDNGRVLRTVLAMIRSGQFGKRSLSSSLQRAFQRWLNNSSVGKLLSASIGNDPALRDVLRLARPTPPDNQRRAFFGWLTDKPVDKWAPASATDLPREVQQLAAFRTATSEREQVEQLRDLPARWDLLADKALGHEVWAALAQRMGPQALRMNLNTLMRHDAIGGGPGQIAAQEIADRLRDPDEIRRSRQFPYQFLAAYLHADAKLPAIIRAALHEAAELACQNVPTLSGPVVIGVDVSGSMSAPVTGQRGRSATSKMRCVDVAGLIAAALLRRNPDSVVIPFDDRVHQAAIDASDSILSLAQRLAKFGGGGTNCALPLQEANTRLREQAFIGCVLISDNQSWLGAGQHGSTGVVTQWQTFVANQRRLRTGARPKLACIDLQPYLTTQAPEGEHVLNIGGFSDAVFSVLAGFFSGDEARFVAEVEAVAL